VVTAYAAAVIAMDVEGAGAPLVLLHGVGTSRAVWRRVVPLLAAERRVAAPDLPGFGHSPALEAGFALERAADVLAEALAAELREPFDLLGNSLGGALALLIAARRPGLVRRLVLAAPAGLSPRPAPVAALAGAGGSILIGLRRRVGPALADSSAGRRLLLLGVVADPGLIAADETRRLVTASRGSSRVREAIAAVAAADLRPLVASLDQPLGLLWGSRDRVVPVSTLRSLRALRPDARVAMVPQAGHVPQVERPYEFVATVRRLLV
jgi:pimeloyl-ACP methyl ester carboxylesterase